jgi:hypothetical protein
MYSASITIPMEGASGFVLTGPHHRCGREDRGGVGFFPLDSKGNRQAGGVITREDARMLHHFLGMCIAEWDSQPRPQKKKRK